jgi:transmembrane sensor
VTRRLLDRWRKFRRDRQAAAWVIRIDEGRDRHEEGLRRWVGGDQDRADAYNRAYRAFHGASSAARQIYARQTSPSQPMRLWGKNWGWVRLVAVTGFSLVVASAALFLLLRHLDLLEHHAGAPSQVYVTKVGEVRPVRLADGSKLTIDTDTIVRVSFSSAERRVVVERGRVRFEVTHDVARPFIVLAGGATITDRGTVFDVEAYRAVSVRLISGAVEIGLPRRAGWTASPVMLRPGQQFRFDPTMQTPPDAPQPTALSDVQWVSGMKTFDDVPVSSIIEEVNRYSTTKISLGDPTIGAQRVFLDLDIRDTAEVAHNLAAYLRLEVDASEPSTLMLRRQQVVEKSY